MSILVVSLGAFLLGCWFLPCKKKLGWVAALFGVVLALASAVHLLSLRLAGSGFNEAVLYHMLVGIEGAGLREYTSSILLAGLLLIASALYAACCYWLVLQLQSKRWVAVLASVGMLGAFGINPGITGTVYTFRVYLADEPVTALPQDLIYEKPTSLHEGIEKPKNLVLIYAESLEAGYLDEQQFPGLTPNLNALREESVNFTELESLPGMTWTIGGMVASQCGIPLVTASNIKNAHTKRQDFLAEAYCLGDVLSEYGYEQHYMGGADARFADKDLFYLSHGAQVVEGREQLRLSLDDPEYINQWGLYDDSLLAMAKTRFDTLSEQEDPFALTILTLDTHHPKGHVSQSCRDTPFQDGRNPILNAVHCTDRLLSEFVNYIHSTDKAQETLVVLMSDHLALPNTASDLLNQHPRRNLFMMLRNPSDELVDPIEVSTEASLMDVAPTVLHQLGFDIQALGYGRNLLTDEITFMQSHVDPEAAMRERFPTVRHLWQYPSLHKGLLLNLSEMHASIGTHGFSLPALITLQPNMRLDQTLSADKLLSFLEASHEVESFLWVDECQVLPGKLLPGEDSLVLDNGMCLLAGSKGKVGREAMRLSGENERLITLDTLSSFMEIPDNGGYSKALLAHLKRREAGGEMHLTPTPATLNNDTPGDNVAILARAEPLQNHAFVGWLGLHDRRRLEPSIITTAYELATLQPEFDVHSASESVLPEFRSAWVAMVIKGGPVLSDHFSPGGVQDSVSRRRVELADGSELDARATGGFLAKNWQNAYLRRDGEHLMSLQRGINLWVLAPEGEQADYHFDTHGDPLESVQMVAVLDELPIGSLLVFVTTDEFTSALTGEAVAKLHELGVLQP